MNQLHSQPANNRMAFIGANSGIPALVQERLDAAPGRLADLHQDISAEALQLPRLSLLFSNSVFQCMRSADASQTSDNTNCHGMGLFFGTLANLGHQLNTAKLADCQFMTYDRQSGEVTDIPLPEQTGCIQCHWTRDDAAQPPSAQALPAAGSEGNTDAHTMPESAQALQAQHRLAHIQAQIAQRPHLHHPDLLISDNEEDVKAALSQGTPAIFVSPQAKGNPDTLITAPHDNTAVSNTTANNAVTHQTAAARPSLTDPLLIALDFDCTLAGAEGDWLYTQLVSHLPPAERLNHYQRFENVRKDNLLGPGPALTFVQALVGMKKLLALLPTPLDNRLAFAIVTARGQATKDRVHRNLAHYIPDYQRVLGLSEVTSDSNTPSVHAKKPGIHFMDGQPKRPRLEALQADLYLDDSATHTADARASVPTGEILWGPNYAGDRVFNTHPALTDAPHTPLQTTPYVIVAPPQADKPLEGPKPQHP